MDCLPPSLSVSLTAAEDMSVANLVSADFNQVRRDITEKLINAQTWCKELERVNLDRGFYEAFGADRTQWRSFAKLTLASALSTDRGFIAMVMERDEYTLSSGGDIDVAMDVRQDAVVPHEAGPFDAQEVPVIGVVRPVLIEGKVEPLQAAAAA